MLAVPRAHVEEHAERSIQGIPDPLEGIEEALSHAQELRGQAASEFEALWKKCAQLEANACSVHAR